MAVVVSDAFVLRTWPLREADLIVSFFTRDQGKLRGTARRARSPKSRFGSGLERLSQVRMFYYQRENRELVSLDSCELVASQFSLASDYTAGVALDFMAELAEQLLPPEEPNDRFFRLLLAVMEHLHQKQAAGVWAAVNYFTLWAVRLSGFLPELALDSESREIAEEMLKTPIGKLTEREWSRTTAAGLRRFLIRAVQEQIERKLVTVPLLETA